MVLTPMRVAYEVHAVTFYTMVTYSRDDAHNLMAKARAHGAHNIRIVTPATNGVDWTDACTITK